jgi:hypothetical protein
MGARCYIPPSQGNIGFISFISGPVNNPGSTQVGIQFNVDGTISVFSTASMTGAYGVEFVNIGPIISTSTESVYVPGIPFYFEMCVTCGTSNGSIQVNINETTVLYLNGINTNPTGVGYLKGFALYCGGSALNAGYSPYVTDIYVCDNTGSNWNTFQGDVNIQSLFPVANHTVQFVPTGSTNWQNVAQVPPNAGSYYNTGNTANQTDTFTMGSLSANTADILGVVVRTLASGPAGGLHTFQQVVQSNVNVSVSNAQTLTTAFVYYDNLFNVDPNTGEEWTVNAVNNIIVGYEILT